MTPKEQALDIIQRFECITCPEWENGRNDATIACATLCVEQILEARCKHTIENNKAVKVYDQYWIDVLEEVLKLKR